MHQAKRLAVVLAATCISTGCATVGPNGNPRVDQPLGSTWVNSVTSTGSFGSGTTQTISKRAAARMWQGQRVYVVERSNQPALLQAANSNWVALVKGEEPVLSYDPPAAYDWPLAVGKAFTAKFNITEHATKRTIPAEQQYKVEAYEDVVVPAGTFKVFRVSMVDNLGSESTSWYSSELGIFIKQRLTRTAKHRAGAGTQETELVSQTIAK